MYGKGVNLNSSGAPVIGLVDLVGYIHPFSSIGSELMVSPPVAYKYPEYLSNRKYLVLYLALKFSSIIRTAGWPSGLFSVVLIWYTSLSLDPLPSG